MSVRQAGQRQAVADQAESGKALRSELGRRQAVQTNAPHLAQVVAPCFASRARTCPSQQEQEPITCASRHFERTTYPARAAAPPTTIAKMAAKARSGPPPAISSSVELATPVSDHRLPTGKYKPNG